MSILRDLSRHFLASLGAIDKSDFRLQVVNDHPASESMAPGCIYVVESMGLRKWAYLRCPSLPEEIIQLSLMTSRRPSWVISMDWLNRPTLHPSIRQTEGSYAHFWIRQGRLHWCEDSGRPYRNIY